ncbi:SDR family NAD(P)-dependent oxidoreductase [Parafrankia discariae]|uniref:SDR family NAD(P)-dependent oxidoreductase n=1 Tax=Parafrankia discariae TaxID=365528 RepID=UPI00036748B2|nr:SDR family NAD(P)-dependent oxidoreductase [Parafrankia discariae]
MNSQSPDPASPSAAVARPLAPSVARPLARPAPRPVALVTGCSSGIGLRSVPALVRRGFHVVATLRDLDRRGALDKVADEHVTVLRVDVTDQRTIDETVAAVLAATGRIDVLVNNAGTAPPNFVEEAPLAQWRSVFETNLFGQVAMTNAVLPAMRARGRGRVVMVSSVGGRAPTPMLGVYCASKFALEGYAETLRLELRHSGIDVVLVEPGSYRTAIYDTPLLDAPVPVESPYADDFVRLRAFYGEYIAHHLRDPDEVAELVATLAARPRRRLRHPVGTDAWIKLALHALLPWPAYERLTRRLIGLRP